jgi:hypothetical protein
MLRIPRVDGDVRFEVRDPLSFEAHLNLPPQCYFGRRRLGQDGGDISDKAEERQANHGVGSYQ